MLHRFVHSYAVDGEPVQNPLWLHGNKLEVETLSATASNHSCATLQRAVEGAGLDIAGFILESVAASWALLSSDEREMGVGILDIGAGTSDLAVYKGTLRHVGQIPFGSEDITKDLSVVLNISPREAEQLKREYGSVCCPAEEADEVVTFHHDGRTASHHRPASTQCHHRSQTGRDSRIRRPPARGVARRRHPGGGNDLHRRRRAA